MAWQRGSERRLPPITPSVLERGEEHTGDDSPRVMLHVDMDAFFASVEERDNPDLKGKPVAVGGGGGFRGVVTAANYIARKYGLRAGMPSGEARRLCPHAIFLPVNGRKYTFVSAQIMTALERFSPSVKPLSVDEASLDISTTERLFGSPLELGQRLKDMVKTHFDLPCSVGIGPNRLVAKMASNLGKPDGLLHLTEETAAVTFAPLPVEKMIGIGDSTRQSLEKLGIVTLGQLAMAPESILKARFGVLGPYLKDMAQGKWSGRMRRDEERGPVEKSIGHQRTFGENISDLNELRGKLVALAEMVARRVRKGEFVGQVLTLKVRYPDFRTPHHQTRLPIPTDDEETIIEYAWRLLSEIHIPGHEVRLLGLSLGAIVPKREWEGQLELFSAKKILRRENLDMALDLLRERFGERVVARAMGERWRRRERRSFSEEVIPYRGTAGTGNGFPELVR